MPADSFPLPDPLRKPDGAPIVDAASWAAQREVLLDQFQSIVYGPLPPVPENVDSLLLIRRDFKRLNGVRQEAYRITTGPTPPVTFVLHLFLPPGDGPHPVVIDGDDCWRSVTDDILGELIERGCALALFNRTEIMPDAIETFHDCALAQAEPEKDYRALAAWAWGYHRCVDVLTRDERIDRHRIVATGHSRGGKTALLAGATDERIALVNPNNSGAGGSGCFRYHNPGSETLANGGPVRHSFWYTPRLREWVGREQELPIDLHQLKALVAPRLLLTTEALGDLWANPAGSLLTHEAAQGVFDLLGVPDHNAIHYRPGPHAQGLEDWRTLLDFADHHWHGKPLPPSFDLSQVTPALRESLTA